MTDLKKTQKAQVLEAWTWLRKNNHSVPDNILDLMRDAALEKIYHTEHYPFFKTDITNKWYYCYRDLSGLNQHSRLFDTPEEALQDYSNMTMLKIEGQDKLCIKYVVNFKAAEYHIFMCTSHDTLAAATKEYDDLSKRFAYVQIEMQVKFSTVVKEKKPDPKNN